MKRLSIIGLTSLLLAHLAAGQSSFINNQPIVSPPDPAPQGWLPNYINNNSISVSFGTPFFFFDVLNFTNQSAGFMSSPLGFRFDTTPSSGGTNKPAVSFLNSNTARIAAGSNATPPWISAPPVQIGAPPPIYPQLLISATNVTSPGLLGASVHGLISIKGRTLNLNRSPIHIETFGDAIGDAFPIGIFDDTWEVAQQNGAIRPTHFTLPDPFSPTTPGMNSVSVPGAQVYANRIIIDTNIAHYQFIFVSESGGDPAITVDAGFNAGNAEWMVPVVQWRSVTTNSFGSFVTNRIGLTDQFAVQNGTGLKLFGFTPGGLAEGAPTNYTITTPSVDTVLTPGNLPYDPGILIATNAFSSNTPFTADTEISFWAVQPKPFTRAPDITDPFQNGANVPGRIEIAAEGPGSTLDVSRSRISGPNFLKLEATNHFVSSGLAQILAHQTSLNLGSTNGDLKITNLVAPFLTRLNGTVTMWSAKWENQRATNIIETNIDMGTGETNIVTNDFTFINRFHVLMANSVMLPTNPAFVQSATLRSTNVEVSDILNMTSNLLVNAQNLTITSNNPPRPNTMGEIHLSPNTLVWLVAPAGPPPSGFQQPILWSPSFPILQNLTNFGLITAPNSIFFSHRASEFFPSPGDTPYARFVNHNDIRSSGGVFIWADYVENTSLGTTFAFGTNYAFINAAVGDLTVTANNTFLANGEFDSLSGSMSFTSGNLVISNQLLFAAFYPELPTPGGSLTFNVTSNFSDGNTVGNFWESLDGMYLPTKPATGDLLGTEIRLDAFPNAEVNVVWAGEDRGPGTAGYSNNVAIGHLILFGGDEFSSWHFIGPGPGASNAIYVDLLELAGGATDANAFNIDPNMTIYFNRATNSGTDKDLTLTLDGAFGGRMQAVAGFTGLFNVGPNSLPGNNNITLSINLTGQPASSALVSWQAVANKTNTLYSSPTFPGSNWTLVTNIVQGPTSTLVSVPQPISGPAKYYKVVIQ